MVLMRHRRSLGNLVALTTIQLANSLLPLLAYPLLLLTVGAEPFSRIVVTESIAYVALTLVIFSFDIDGVTRIAHLDTRADIGRISAIFSELFVARMLLLASCVVMLLLASPFMAPVTVRLLLAWTLFPLAYILQSAWFFQAIERNAVPAAIIMASRISCLALLRLLIVSPGDYYLAPIVIGTTYAGGGALLFLHALVTYRVRIVAVSFASNGDIALRYGRSLVSAS